MSEAQLITIVVVFLGVSVGILFNNSRITDLRNVVDTRINDVNRHIDDKYNLLAERIQRMDENFLRLIADQDARIRRLEKVNE